MCTYDDRLYDDDRYFYDESEECASSICDNTYKRFSRAQQEMKDLLKRIKSNGFDPYEVESFIEDLCYSLDVDYPHEGLINEKIILKKVI